MSTARDAAAPDPVPQREHAAPDVELGRVPGAGPGELLARAGRDRAPIGAAASLARAVGNRAMLQLARAPGQTASSGTYVDPTADPGYARILGLLQRTPWGRDALAVMTKYRVKTVFATDGPPANFAQELNRVRLNTTLRDDVLSSYFVHEMYHASQFHEGRSPGPSSHDDMGKWVKLLVDEEIEGTALGYLHKLQLERTVPRATADDEPPHMSFFRNAFDAGYREAIAAGQGVDDARAAGRARGRRMAEYLIRPAGGDRHRLGVGEWLSYSDYYTREWKQAHKAPAGAPSPH